MLTLNTFAYEALQVKKTIFRQFDGLSFASLVAALARHFACTHKHFHRTTSNKF